MDYSHLLKKLPHSFDLVIPFLKFNVELERELLLKKVNVFIQNEKFILCESLTERPIWAQDWWPDTQVAPYKTKSDALKVLKSQKNLGAYYNTGTTTSAFAQGLRRDLRELEIKRIDYKVPSKFNFNYFTWTVLDHENLLVCAKPFSRFPLGWHEFIEDKIVPPNRAYLKLWEVLCLGLITLQPDDVAIDVGSSPGGWTWALSEQVKKVYSVDKAALDPKISKSPSIVFKAGDAFKLDPKNFKDCTWLFSDIICTPERLYELVQRWMNESKVQNYVCTIKFKGPSDFDMIQKFQEFEHSKIIHLYQNKNEVTWIKQRTV